MASVILKPGREKSLLRRHPWIFSGAIASVDGSLKSGETVEVYSSDSKTCLGYGAYSPNSQITIRMWSFDSLQKINSFFIKILIENSIKRRDSFIQRRDITAYRLINAESDCFPGLVVDRYNNFLVCQFLSAGAEFWKNEIVCHLKSLLPECNIYERSDVDVRNKENLPLSVGVLSGEEPPNMIEIQEKACRFAVDIKKGHKTGFYLDQRSNRMAIAEFAKNAEVLNCFSYTGGFSVWALYAGAKHVTNVESSADALSFASYNVKLNKLDVSKIENVEGDVFQVLRKYRDSRRTFDLIVLDPPKFVESQGSLNSAARGYKDINLLAFKLLRPGGILFTFSCSGLLGNDLFQKIVADSAVDAKRDVQIIRKLGQPEDHPILLSFPESSYLKGLICRVL